MSIQFTHTHYSYVELLIIVQCFFFCLHYSAITFLWVKKKKKALHVLNMKFFVIESVPCPGPNSWNWGLFQVSCLLQRLLACRQSFMKIHRHYKCHENVIFLLLKPVPVNDSSLLICWYKNTQKHQDLSDILIHICLTASEKNHK